MKNGEVEPLRTALKEVRLTNVDRIVQINATLLLHNMRGVGGWEDVRWFQMVSVVEKWIGALGESWGD